MKNVELKVTLKLSNFQEAIQQEMLKLAREMEKQLYENSTLLYGYLSSRPAVVKDDEYWRKQNQRVIDTALVREFSKKFDELRESYRGISLSFDECGVYASVGSSPSIIIADYYN